MNCVGKRWKRGRCSSLREVRPVRVQSLAYVNQPAFFGSQIWKGSGQFDSFHPQLKHGHPLLHP